MDRRALDEIGRRDQGVLGACDAEALDTTPDALRMHRRRQQLASPWPGVVLLAGSLRTFEQAVMVAVKALGGRRVLACRRTAAYLLGIVRERPATVEVLVPFDRHHPAFSDLRLRVVEGEQETEVRVVVHRSRTLVAGDATDLGGIPVTTPARTLVDLAQCTPLADLRILVIDARQRRIATLAAIRAVHERIRRYPGRPKMRRVLTDLDERDCDSRLEWVFREEAAWRGFTPHPRPFPFRCSDGITIEIDVAFPLQWVAGECDGLGSRADRASLSKHHKRQNRAVADGWRPFLVDWTRLTRETDALFDELAWLLEQPPPFHHPAPLSPDAPDPRFRGRRRR